MYINPYKSVCFDHGYWLRSNFHTHAGTGRGTCGAYEIEDVISLYKEAGYDVLSISNHDLFSDVQKYQEKYNMILFNAYEYSTDPHMLCIDIRNVTNGMHQEAINRCLEQGGFTVLCHPNWQKKEYWPWKEIDGMKGYLGIEIFNSLIFRLSGSGLATDTWDYLLSQGKLVWGFGDDDFHRWFDLAKAWNVIYSPSKTQKDIRTSINNGSFYVSNGLILNEFSLNDNILRLSATSQDTYVKNNKYVFTGENGQILDEQYAESGEYCMAGNEKYVRVQVVSEHGAMLWTQPIYKEELFVRP